jgi:TRAP-type mannitol/chloroaromatic compound transport system substrate-binding protein
MRIPGLGGDVYQRAGGTSVSLPGGEVYTSMQTGVIDATEWIGPYNDLALGLHRVGRYFYYPGWQEPSATLEAIVNKDAWDALPEDLQMILKTATRAINQDMLDEFTARNAQALKRWWMTMAYSCAAFPTTCSTPFVSTLLPSWKMLRSVTNWVSASSIRI